MKNEYRLVIFLLIGLLWLVFVLRQNTPPPPPQPLPEPQEIIQDPRALALALLGNSDVRIEDAYAMMGQSYTDYSPLNSALTEAQNYYLDTLFILTDVAARARLLFMNQLMGQSPGITAEDYKGILDEVLSIMQILTPPEDMGTVHALIATALKEQRLFLLTWDKLIPEKKSAFQDNYAEHDVVKSANKKLDKAHREIASAYPHDTPHNTQAIENHLEALSF